MTFVVPQSDADKPENRFEFEIAGEKYTVPKYGFAPVEATMLFQEGLGVAGMLACMDDDTAAAVRTLDRDQFQKLDAAWTAASKVSPGESEGSAGS